MKTKIQKRKILTSNSISSNNISSQELEDHIQLKNINKDVVDLISKYSGGKNNLSVYSEKLEGKEGFFLMWVKKDLSLPENSQIQITTFAKSINVDEMILSMQKVIADIANEQKIPQNFA